MKGALHTVTWGDVLCSVEISYRQSTGLENRVGRRTQKMLSGIASLHITIGHQYAFQSILEGLQTCERLEIRCECAANQETESDDLYR